MKTLKILFALPIFCLTGCLPVYTPTDPNSTVAIDVSELVNPQMTFNGNDYILQKDDSGFTKIPYGRIVKLTNVYHTSGGSVTYSCAPDVSFFPKVHHEYYANFLIKDDKCALSVLELTRKRK